MASYSFEEFPKWVYSEIKKELVIVKDAVEEHSTSRSLHRRSPRPSPRCR